MRNNGIRCVAVALACEILLTGCGTMVPALSYSYRNEYDAGAFVNSVAGHVHCSLGKAVRRSLNTRGASWLEDWSAKVTLTLTVGEKSTIAPGAAVTRWLPIGRVNVSDGSVVAAQESFGLGFGGSYKREATRKLSITWFVVFKELANAKDNGKECEIRTPYSVQGDLKIFEGLNAGVTTATIFGNISQPFETGGPLQVIEHQVTFDTMVDGNVTPSWKLVDVSVNSGGGFFSGGRSKKDDLLITMGPTQLTATNRKIGKPVVGPSAAVENAHLAAQIGTAVSSALQR